MEHSLIFSPRWFEGKEKGDGHNSQFDILSRRANARPEPDNLHVKEKEEEKAGR